MTSFRRKNIGRISLAATEWPSVRNSSPDVASASNGQLLSLGKRISIEEEGSGVDTEALDIRITLTRI